MALNVGEEAIEFDLAFDIAHELLNSADLRARFPQFTGLHGDETAYFEPGGGFLRPERCIATQLALARRHGAEIVTGCEVLAVERSAGSVRLRHADGEVRADKVVLAAGPWMPTLAGPTVAKRLRTVRQVLHWFAVEEKRAWRADASPTFIWTHGLRSEDQFYGFPPINGEVKVAAERYDTAYDPDDPSREATVEEAEWMANRHVTGNLAGLGFRPVRSKACLYTVTPDQHFLIGSSDATTAVTIVSACSGHGFKHAAAVGEAVAANVAGDAATADLSAFAFPLPPGG